MTEAAYLLLEDGTIFHGTSFGAPLPGAGGEAAFWTGMTDYQETISDPALSGKLLVLTHPGVGNAGMNAHDVSADAPTICGLIVREASSIASNYRSEESLSEYLIRHGIPAITGVDTRALTIHLRENGPLQGIIGAGDPKALEEKLRAPSAPALLSPSAPTEWSEGSGEWKRVTPSGAEASERRFKLGVLDWGARRDLLRLLVDVGADVIRIPSSHSAEEILALELSGLVLPNGSYEALRGDAALRETLAALAGKLPLLGVDVGALLLAESLGAKSEKLSTGRRGPNHTVKALESGALLTTTQNHGHRTSEESLPSALKITHRHLHDGDVQGFIDADRKLLGVQYSPERADDPSLQAFLGWLG